jgi:Tol biopolymer transport system component
MTAHIPSGSKLGRYEIRSHIGAGGMGDVYLARDTELDRSVALKVLPPSVATDQQRMRRFVQEAKAASSLNHQNIITIYEIGETDATRFIATEFVDGGTVYQIPLLGGTPRKVIDRVRSPISFSPDGSQFAFMREDERQASSLVIANTDGSGERTLAVRKGNDWFAPDGPAWSPDGRFVANGVGTDTGGSHMTVVAYSVADGSEKALTSHKWRGDVRRLFWLKDGSGLVLPVLESAHGAQLWFISQPDGAVRRITNDLNGYGSVSFGVSADSKTIVTVQSKPSYQIWTTTLGEPAQQAVQITHGDNDGMGGLDWTPDGEIVYFTNTGETNDLLKIKSDGTNARTLTEDPKGPSEPSVSPDGKSVYFDSVRSGLSHIWRVSADGSDLKQFTSGLRSFA